MNERKLREHPISQTGNVLVARIVTDERTARRLAHLVEETLDGIAASAYETGNRWTFEAILPRDADLEILNNLLREELGASANAEFEPLAERDWVQASLTGLNPVRAGRFFVHGAHDRQRVPANALGIEVEAALAFGTGHHGTTRGCLLALNALLKRDKLRRVLDVGTGSGVLAIAAALASHARVEATDIDPAAVRIARGNISLNRAKVFVRVRVASRLPERRHGGGYDLILANILAPTLIALSNGLARNLNAGGAIVLSGLLAHQAAAVIASFRAQGGARERRGPLDEWVTLIMRRNS